MPKPLPDPYATLRITSRCPGKTARMMTAVLHAIKAYGANRVCVCCTKNLPPHMREELKRLGVQLPDPSKELQGQPRPLVEVFGYLNDVGA